LEEQAKLNATKVAEVELKDKLTVAVDHLEKAHEQLLQRSQSLRLFLQRFAGADELGKRSVALLQQSAVHPKQSNLTSFVNTSHGPQDLYATINSQIEVLVSHLADTQKQHHDVLSKQRHQYEEKLRSQRVENERLEQNNSAIVEELEKFRKTNAEIRKKAAALTKVNEALVTDLEILQENLSTADESVANALGTYEKDLKAPSLSVLANFADEDAANGKALAHKKQMTDVSKMAMVQFGVQLPEASQPNAQDLLASLFSSLSDISSEQNMNEASLHRTFNSAYLLGEERHKALLQEQARLTVARETEEELQVKLSTALDHLQATHKALFERSRATRSYLVHLLAHLKVQ